MIIRMIIFDIVDSNSYTTPKEFAKLGNSSESLFGDFNNLPTSSKESPNEVETNLILSNLSDMIGNKSSKKKKNQIKKINLLMEVYLKMQKLLQNSTSTTTSIFANRNSQKIKVDDGLFGFPDSISDKSSKTEKEKKILKKEDFDDDGGLFGSHALSKSSSKNPTSKIKSAAPKKPSRGLFDDDD
jgi:hypothetical protein